MKNQLFILLISLIALFFSCKNEDIINTPELISTQASQDHLFAESAFNDVAIIIEEAFQDNGMKKSCPQYNIINSDTSNIDTLVIDFGDECWNNGKLRNGRIILTYNGKYRDPLTLITITFDNYHVYSNLIYADEMKITNHGQNNQENIWYTIEVKNARLATDNGTIDWESNISKELIHGEETYFDLEDDVYKIFGEASGIAVNNSHFSVEIIDTLYLDLGCKIIGGVCPIRKGTSQVSINNYDPRMIHYGDSICDCNVDVNINGVIYPLVID